MTLIRSIIFNTLFYVSNAVQMIFWIPIYFISPRWFRWKIVHWWSHSLTWLMKVIVGTSAEFHGTENIPNTGAIIAPKHQSAWDTFVLVPHLHDPVYILKRELMWIPMFGWYVARMNMVPIDRGSRDKAIKKVNEGARREMAKGRQLVIYPEGTRRQPGSEPQYKSGIAYLYEATGMPVVPVAHNAGVFWPKGSVMRYPGTFQMEFLEPIPPGMGRKEFMAELERRLETASDRLLLNAAQADNPPPLSDIAQKRVQELLGADDRAQPSMA